MLKPSVGDLSRVLYHLLGAGVAGQFPVGVSQGDVGGLATGQKLCIRSSKPSGDVWMVEKKWLVELEPITTIEIFRGATKTKPKIMDSSRVALAGIPGN